MTDLSMFHPEAMRALQDDHWAAQRDAALERVKAAINHAQEITANAHRTHGLNLVDAQSYLQYARDAVESESEP